jgi:hypothetical protein
LRLGDYNEFFARPALDRTVRVALLVTSLFVIAAIAAVFFWGWSALERRFDRTLTTGDHPRC